MTKVPEDIANTNYGIACDHEAMANGEIRFRLISKDGSVYVRTESGENGAWQNSHFHKNAKETYIVQTGWMAFASNVDEELDIVILRSGDELTIKPFTIHNVYLPGGAVIHTVKHGAATKQDWFEDVEFDRATKHLSEKDIMRIANKTSRRNDSPSRFDTYVTIYNNLDNLLWRIPSLFVGGAAILIGFVANIASKPNTSLSPELWSVIFFLIGTLFLVGTYSMLRIRIHHSIMGNELRRLEDNGYFHTRAESVKRLWPGAPIIFVVVFSALGLALVGLGLVAIFSFESLEPFLTHEVSPSNKIF